ncbi:hypothetical protein [Spiroplasma endosymbiont of Atherix ibis]|uniref:hypothetical protein n=1 Tax=Spiroplasma endosymbiont of Atherix ibis TaxID=3066291 RepID=UPI0030CBF18D
MKKLFIFFTFFLFIPTLLNLYSCGFNQEKEGYFPEKENMIDISTIESDIKEPLPLSNK